MEPQKLKQLFLEMGFNPARLHAMPEEAFKMMCEGEGGRIFGEFNEKFKDRKTKTLMMKNLLHQTASNPQRMPADKLPAEAKAKLSKWTQREALKKELLQVTSQNQVLKGKIRNELHKGNVKKIEEGKLNEKIINLRQKTFLITEQNDELKQLLEQNTKKCKYVEGILKKKRPDNIGEVIISTIAAMAELNAKQKEKKVVKRNNGIASSTLLDSDNSKPSASCFVPMSPVPGPSISNIEMDKSDLDDNLITTSEGVVSDMSIFCEKIRPLFEKNFRCFGNDEFTNVTDELVKMLRELDKKIIEHIGDYSSSRMEIFDDKLEQARIMAKVQQVKFQIVENKEEAERLQQQIEDHLDQLHLSEKEREYVDLCAEIDGMKAASIVFKNRLQEMKKQAEPGIKAKEHNIKLLEQIRELTKEIYRVKYNIERGFKDAEFYMESIRDLESNLPRTFNTSVFSFDWQTTNYTHLDEARLLKHLPTHYNRKFANNCDNIWKIILNQNQTETIKALTRLLKNPTIRPSSILIQVIQTKMAFYGLTKLKSKPIFDINQQVTFTDADFSRHNSELKAKASAIVNDLEMMKPLLVENKELMTNFFNPRWELAIKESRLVEGHNIIYYRKQYENLKKKQNQNRMGLSSKKHLVAPI